MRNPGGAWRDLSPPGNRLGVRWNETNSLFKLIIKRNGLDGLGLDLSRSVDLKVRLRQYEGGGGLQVAGPCAAICVRWIDAHSTSNRPTYIQNTIIHEMGHAFGLAATRHPDNSNIPMPAETYSLHGLHCHENTDGCNMYGTVRLSNTAYCDNCTQAVRGRMLTGLPREGDEAFS